MISCDIFDYCSIDQYVLWCPYICLVISCDIVYIHRVTSCDVTVYIIYIYRVSWHDPCFIVWYHVISQHIAVRCILGQRQGHIFTAHPVLHWPYQPTPSHTFQFSNNGKTIFNKIINVLYFSSIQLMSDIMKHALIQEVLNPAWPGQFRCVFDFRYRRCQCRHDLQGSEQELGSFCRKYNNDQLGLSLSLRKNKRIPFDV